MNIRKIKLIVLMMTIAIIFTACGKKTKENKENNTVVEDNKIQIIATLFPQYDFIKAVGKDKVEVSLLLSPGVESHSYEPTPQDMVNIRKADMFVYTSELMEPWAVKISDTIEKKEVLIVDASKGISFMAEDHAHEEEHAHEDEHSHEEDNHEEEHDHGGTDPHIWLDPTLAQKMVDNIAEALVKIDKTNEEFYLANAKEYKKQLDILDKEFQDTFSRTKSNKIIYGGHFAFGYFAERYGLEYISPYKGFSPDAEPTPRMIIDLINTINEAGIKAIYHEELIDPKVAKILADETGAKMLLLHGAHNLSKEELDSNITYLEIMRGNMNRLKEGLGYE